MKKKIKKGINRFKDGDLSNWENTREQNTRGSSLV